MLNVCWNIDILGANNHIQPLTELNPHPSALVDYINLVSNNYMWNECWKIDVWEQTTTFNHWQNWIFTSSVLVDDINLLSDNYTYMLNVCWKIDITETNKHVHTTYIRPSKITSKPWSKNFGVLYSHSSLSKVILFVTSSVDMSFFYYFY